MVMNSGLSIRDALYDAKARLAAVSASASLDAQLLLAEVLQVSRAYVLAHGEDILTPQQVADYEAWIVRREPGEPVAYILGRKPFYDREFAVSPAVLIPRPETELLIELALQLTSSDQPLSIADLGTGSGALAITLALERPLAQVTATDLSPTALAVARRNATQHAARNVRFLLSDWFAVLPEKERFDLIMSNPPYLAENDPHLARGDVRFEPLLALRSGPDGLNDIRRIILNAPARLATGGWLLCEHGYDQSEVVRSLLRQAGLLEVASYPDLQGHLRVSGGRLN